MKPKKLVISLICLLLSVWMFAALPVGAIGSGYYSAYSTPRSIIDKKVDGHNFVSMQGCAVGSTYLYTIKTTGEFDYQMLRKTVIKEGGDNEGVTTILKFSGKEYTDKLGHGNDMDVCTIDGYSTLFVATMLKGSYSLVRIKVSGSTATITGHYTLKYDSKQKSISGIAVFSNDKTNKKTTLLCKDGADFYKVTIPWSTTSATYTLTKAFSVNRTTVTINGEKIKTPSSGWYTQGIAYKDGYVFYPLTEIEGNTSIVAVYNVKNAKASSVVNNMSSLSFKITETKFPALFEIESVGICPSNNKLYFTTNRRKTANDTDYDAIHYFTNYRF